MCFRALNKLRCDSFVEGGLTFLFASRSELQLIGSLLSGQVIVRLVMLLLRLSWGGAELLWKAFHFSHNESEEFRAIRPPGKQMPAKEEPEEYEDPAPLHFRLVRGALSMLARTFRGPQAADTDDTCMQEHEHAVPHGAVLPALVRGGSRVVKRHAALSSGAISIATTVAMRGGS